MKNVESFEKTPDTERLRITVNLSLYFVLISTLCGLED